MNDRIKAGLSAIWILLCVFMIAAAALLASDAKWEWKSLRNSGDFGLAMILTALPAITFGTLIWAASTHRIKHLLDACGWPVLNCELINENDNRGIASGD